MKMHTSLSGAVMAHDKGRAGHEVSKVSPDQLCISYMLVFATDAIIIILGAWTASEFGAIPLGVSTFVAETIAIVAKVRNQQ